MAVEQRLHPLAGARRDSHLAAGSQRAQQALALVLAQQVDLVQHLDARLAQRTPARPAPFRPALFCSSP